MKRYKWMTLGLGMALMLSLAACSQQEAEETASPTPDPTATPVQEEVVESPAVSAEPGLEETEESQETLTLTASFQDEAGAALAGATVRFTVGNTEAEYLTGEDGALTVASLPLTGTVEVALLDDEGTETATATLELTQGSVTDVTEGEDGAWLVTLLTDADTLSLSFVQTDDGALTCALDLDEAA